METLIISSGVVSSGLSADLSRDIIVLGGGTLTDSIATNSGMIYIDSDYSSPETNVSGGILQRVTATKSGEVWVYNFGSALEITAEDKGYFNIAEGSIDSGLVHSGGYGIIYNDGTADHVTAGADGKFYNVGGKVRNTVVSSGGSFVVQMSTAETSATTILDGGVMRIVSAGNAADTTVNGGFLEVDSGTAATTVISAGSVRVNMSNTIESATLIGGYLEVNDATAEATVVSGGSMRVSSGGIAQNTTISGGILEIGLASGDGNIVTGGTMCVTSASTVLNTTLNDGLLEVFSSSTAENTTVNAGLFDVTSASTVLNTTVNAGQFNVTSAAATGTTILAGTADFISATVSGLTLGSTAVAALDSASSLTGVAVFEAGAAITVDGSIAFDTAFATAETAQITGYSAIANGANVTYTLTVAEAEDIKGTYLLATDAAGFKYDVAFGDYTLAINRKAVFFDGLYYMLSLTIDNNLVLTITDEEPTLPTLVYVNDAWAGKAKGEIVPVGSETAKIGYDAFATADEAVAFIGGDTSVSRELTLLSDASASSLLGFTSLTLDAGSLFSFAGTCPGVSITIDATAYDDFTKKIMVADGGYAPDVTLSVLGEGFGYEFLADGATLLVTSDIVKNVFGNADWTEEDVTGQFVGDVALVWNKNAFNSLEKAAAAIGEGGTLFIEGGTFSEACTLTKGNAVYVSGNTAASAAGSITGDGGSFTVGSDFLIGGISGFSVLSVEADSVSILEGVTLTEGGTLNFLLANTSPGNTDALVNDLSLVAGDPAYTLTVVGTEEDGTYKLAGGAAGFEKTLAVTDPSGAVLGTLAVGSTETIDYREYTLGITDNDELALTMVVLVPALAYVNSGWSLLEPGTVVAVGSTSATIGYDAFAALQPAIDAVTDDGAVEIVGGEISFEAGYSKTVTVDAGTDIVGKAVFDKPITVNGTFVFDTAVATAEAAQFGGFSFVSGTATYSLVVDVPVTGTYLLASDAAAFSAGVQFGLYTMNLGETVVVADYAYTLGITDNNELALTIADYVPPTPPTTAVAKSDIDGNGISDVMFVWTGNNYQHGYWMNGTSEWQSAGCGHPAEWENLGCYDMTGNGKADSVLVGNVVVSEVKGAYIGFYTDSIDADANWQNIGYLTNFDDILWINKVGNLTGNESGTNSIVWYAPELYALGAWTDGTENWATLSNNFGGEDWTLIGCGDFDGDGKDSVVMSGLDGMYFYTVDIGGSPVSLGSANWSGWDVRAIGDFLGDGKDDIVLFHKELGAMVMLADGNLDDYTSIGQLDATDWFVVGAGDYNNDAKDDLLVRQYTTGMLGYYVSGDTSQWVELGRGVDMNWTVIA